ncbi:hypothetical protein K2173_006977 [Erythroxylum novogranatense]|uniref:Switch 2 n=1 Tax=Erythroxylum novogranatense TaxID=1862640 RepID=A0AAV8TDA4_9ROSI|nr:hypothetical protein K2173_006977 [Erythroxylum novogranatense]
MSSLLTSFKALKETLRPCTSLSTSSSSSSTQGPQPSALPRKPPKSSLSQQLQRLGDPWVSFPQESPSQEAKTHKYQKSFEVENQSKGGSFENYEEEEDADKELGDFERPKMGRFHFDHTGPFEPLPLSPPGELPIVQVPASINCRLLEHQKEGVKFLYKLYRNNHGGILGDDMGLGKTIQTIAFLAAAIGREGESGDSTLVRENQATKSGHALIICPTSVIQNWETEFSRWATFNVSVYHGATRDLILEKLEARGVEVLITSFDTFRIHGNILSEILWEIVIVDEAHRLKMKSQNYIKHAQKFAQETFWSHRNSRTEATAPEKFVQVADERKEHLVRVLHKYMLRRTKEETIGHLMMGKEDNVIFCAMSELQKRVYRRMLQLSDVQCLINKDLPCSCGSPLKQVECCKRIVPDGIIWPYLHRDNPEGCDSCPFCLVLPCLVKLQQISNHLELIKPNPRDEPDKQRKDAEFASAVFGPDIDLLKLWKMRALEKLMFSWVSQGDKILLFSYSVSFYHKGYSFARLDGSTPTNLRQSMVDDFNSSPSKQVFLISTRAGGLGLNLVSANRVVIFDPNWNPAHDLQAQDRSFRFGQKRHVVVFRLLAAGSFEELVYSRQVYKQQLSNIAVSGKMEKRYFEGVQDCKQFQGELFGICNLFRDLSDKLFTSEIIELHEKDRNDDAHCSATKQERAALDNEKGTTCKPVLEEMGVLYAHRNDEVINVVNLPKKKIARTSAEDYEIATIKQRKKQADDKGRKKKHYVRLSQSLGLGEVEFSKWVLSASPYEREQVLRDYKKRKEKAPSV